MNENGYVRKGWNTGFFQSPDCIFERNDVTTLAKLAYLYLCRRADSEGKSFPGYKRMAKDIGFAKSTAQKKILELEERGLLIIENRYDETTKQNFSNLYTLRHPDEVKRGVYR